MPHSILLVDDSPLIRRSLCALIKLNREWEVCGEAENGAIAIEMVRALHPDVVMLDLRMPVMGGLDAARGIAAIAPNTIMLMFTMHSSEQLTRAARAVGIRHVLSKSDGGAGILAALKDVCFST